MAQHNDLGNWGEELAAKNLVEKGYTILARDWKDKHKDIDIIATDGEYLVFVEVKTRRNNVFMEPEQAVNRTKIKNITLAANRFVKSCDINLPIRFDIISIVGTEESNCRINHIEDAFLPFYFK